MQHLAGCAEPDCCSFPPEFVRVRYYYGQRLGVMELTDEASYHAGEMAFHNRRAHGVGVLCGLSAARFAFTAGAKTTVLRVTRGAALDGCGREILVGVDQCIDVAAWASKNKARLAAWTAGKPQTLVLAVRYRECPSDPSPAPRDPCGCDTGGCEYGRVREGFELGLFTPEEAAKMLGDASFPDPALLLHGVENAPSTTVPANAPPDAHAGGVDAALHTLMGASCPSTLSDEWLALAAVPVVLDAAAPTPIDLGDPDNAINSRRSLLSTAALQTLVLALSGAAHGSGTVGDGPAIGALTFVPSGPSSGKLLLEVNLAQAGSPPVSSPIAVSTFNSSFVNLEVLGSTGWTDAAPTVTYNPSPSRIELDVTGLATGKRYRLSLNSPFATPIADDQGRALVPGRYGRLLAFLPDGTQFKLDPSL